MGPPAQHVTGALGMSVHRAGSALPHVAIWAAGHTAGFSIVGNPTTSTAGAAGCVPAGDLSLLCAGEGAHAGTAPRIELEVVGLCLQADTFDGSGPHARRLAVSVHHAELRDCQVRCCAGEAG